MKRPWVLIQLLSVALAGSLGVLLTSRLYWGHWFGPPAANDTAALLTSLKQFTTFHSGTDRACGQDALAIAGRDSNEIPGEDPYSRLPAALVRRGLAPASAECLPASLVPAITGALRREGELKQGESGYAHATELHGHVATGTSPLGESVVLAALIGGQVSNDHYPYYEVVLASAPSGELQLLHLKFYWFDVAGMEGVAHWFVGIAAAFGTWLLWIFVTRSVLRTKRAMFVA